MNKTFPDNIPCSAGQRKCSVGAMVVVDCFDGAGLQMYSARG